MKHTLYKFFYPLVFALILVACSGEQETNSNAAEPEETENSDDFKYMTEQFADIKIIRYQIPAWDELSLDNKKLAYYLTEAGLAGRDIMYDQNYRHNLTIRRALEDVYRNYDGDKSSDDWTAFETYLKRIWFSNGIHHHYSYDKFEPGFSREFLSELLSSTSIELPAEAVDVIFNPEIDAKKVSKDSEKDLVLSSAVNFYDPDVTQAEVEAFYKKKTANKDPERPIAFGLNSKLARTDGGGLEEKTWKLDGMYSESIEKIIYWLEKAATVAEKEQQKKALDLLIEYYETGDLKTWDAYNIAWVNDTTSTVDYINGFVEVYNDPMGYRGSYETIVQIRDLDASKKMKVIAENAQYFEDESPIEESHKKETVVGISYNFINVAGEAGDASPATPIGVNLPNADWIRAQHGSKSISLGNIVSAYEKAGTSGFLEEFSHDEMEIELSKKHNKVAGKLHTALHEVIGHASGKLNPGVGTPKETLKNYASTLEEARADLVALYYIMDEKLIEMGIMGDIDVGRHAYDDYIKNGMMLQLRRLQPGDIIEEDHMRNRQLVAAWAFEKGSEDNVISKVTKDGKTYFEINDYQKLRELFGELLRIIQKLKSEGDYEAGKALVEQYGVQVDAELHREVLERTEKFNSAPYGGFINPRLVPVMEGDSITDIKVEYPDDFASQMLEYTDKYSTLPSEN